MIIQAELRRKQSEYEGEACSVDKVIELPAQRFKQFSRALLADYDFIAENKNAIRHDDDARHCLLILDAEGKDGFLVDPQGYNYARYSAFVPNARSLLTPDMGIDRSYLSPAEPWRDESRDEMLRMTLRVDGKPDYTLVLPADEEYLDAVKAYLDIDVFADAMLCDIRFKVARLLQIDVRYCPYVNGNCSKGILTSFLPFSRPRSLAGTGQHPCDYLLYATCQAYRLLQDFARREQV